MTIGGLKDAARTLEVRLYRTGELLTVRETPARRDILRRTVERYQRTARRLYRLGIEPGEW